MNWLELPSDVMANILFRVGVFDILKNVQKVCTAWRKICQDPSMWRAICIDFSYSYLVYKDIATRIDYSYQHSIYKDLAMCKHAVDRSQGQLIDITVGDFVFLALGAEDLLQYVANRGHFGVIRLNLFQLLAIVVRLWFQQLLTRTGSGSGSGSGSLALVVLSN